MNEFLDEKIKAVGVRIKQVSAQGHEVLKDLQESKSDDEIEKVSAWIQETETTVSVCVCFEIFFEVRFNAFTFSRASLLKLKCCL